MTSSISRSCSAPLISPFFGRAQLADQGANFGADGLARHRLEVLHVQPLDQLLVDADLQLLEVQLALAEGRRRFKPGAGGGFIGCGGTMMSAPSRGLLGTGAGRNGNAGRTLLWCDGGGRRRFREQPHQLTSCAVARRARRLRGVARLPEPAANDAASPARLVLILCLWCPQHHRLAVIDRGDRVLEIVGIVQPMRSPRGALDLGGLDVPALLDEPVRPQAWILLASIPIRRIAPTKRSAFLGAGGR
jgi:hypothetical protein